LLRNVHTVLMTSSSINFILILLCLWSQIFPLLSFQRFGYLGNRCQQLGPTYRTMAR